MLKVQVLGRPTGDNALRVTADSGQGQTRLLLDCGETTLNALNALLLTELQAIDHLLFSQLHWTMWPASTASSTPTSTGPRARATRDLTRA